MEKSFTTAIKLYIIGKSSGCGSVWLERTAGGREVAGSNPVTPTDHIREINEGSDQVNGLPETDSLSIISDIMERKKKNVWFCRFCR